MINLIPDKYDVINVPHSGYFFFFAENIFTPL